MTATTATLDNRTRTIIQRARNNALAAAANAADDGHAEQDRYNTGKATAFTWYIKNQGDLQAVYDAYPWTETEDHRAGYRDAYHDLARMA